MMEPRMGPISEVDDLHYVPSPLFAAVLYPGSHKSVLKDKVTAVKIV